MTVVEHGTPYEEIYIAPRSGVAFVVPRGDLIMVIDLQGKQVADLVAYCGEGYGEYLSPSHTRVALGNLYPSPGNCFYTNRRRPILRLTEDKVGRHDMLYPPCDPDRYERNYGVKGHPNCLDNLAGALAPYGIGRHRVGDVVNFFMNTKLGESGELFIEEPLSRAGDYVLLKAEVDCLMGVAACSQDLNPCNGYSPSDMMVKLFRGE